MFVAGDTVTWTRQFADFPVSEGWTAKLALRGASTADVTATTADDGVSYEFEISSGASGKLTAGQYEWAAWVELDGEVHTVESGVLTVSANPLTANAGDLVSSAETQLALVDAQIAELLATPIESYAIGARSVTRRKLEDLNKQRGILVARLGRLRDQELPSYAMTFRAPGC